MDTKDVSKNTYNMNDQQKRTERGSSLLSFLEDSDDNDNKWNIKLDAEGMIQAERAIGPVFLPLLDSMTIWKASSISLSSTTAPNLRQVRSAREGRRRSQELYL